MRRNIVRVMREALFVSIALGFFGPVVNILDLGIDAAHAQNSHSCMQIQNEDRRNMCVAKDNKNASVCGMIHDLDMRNLCMAQVQRNRSVCGVIKIKLCGANATQVSRLGR